MLNLLVEDLAGLLLILEKVLYQIIWGVSTFDILNKTHWFFSLADCLLANKCFMNFLIRQLGQKTKLLVILRVDRKILLSWPQFFSSRRICIYSFLL